MQTNSQWTIARVARGYKRESTVVAPAILVFSLYTWAVGKFSVARKKSARVYYYRINEHEKEKVVEIAIIYVVRDL